MLLGTTNVVGIDATVASLLEMFGIKSTCLSCQRRTRMSYCKGMVVVVVVVVREGGGHRFLNMKSFWHE